MLLQCLFISDGGTQAYCKMEFENRGIWFVSPQSLQQEQQQCVHYLCKNLIYNASSFYVGGRQILWL